MSLGRGLATNEALETLALPRSALGAAGSLALALALRESPRLRHLNLSHNGADAATCLALARLLSSSASMEALDLHGSAIGPAGSQSLLQAAAQCASLRRLALDGCSFEPPLAGAAMAASDTFLPSSPNGHYVLDLAGAGYVSAPIDDAMWWDVTLSCAHHARLSLR